MKSPGALAALGAIETGGPGQGRVVLETNLKQNFRRAPIYAKLIGSNRCEAEGITARGSAPVLALCRKLVAAGHDPGTPLEAWRGPTLCLRIRSLGEGAKFTVRTAGNGRPIFAPENGARGSSVRRNASGVVSPRSDAKRVHDTARGRQTRR